MKQNETEYWLGGKQVESPTKRELNVISNA